MGPLELISDGRSVKIGGPRERVVLAALALRVNRVTSFAQLMEAVWDDDPPLTARGQIQSSVSALRRLFTDCGLPEAIKTHASGYLLNLSDDDLDSERFSKLVATAHQQIAERRTADAAATLRMALSLWRGPAMDGVQSDHVARAASVLDDGRLTATEERLRLDLELGRHEELVSELLTLLTENPWRERLYGFLMLALYRCGRQTDALDVCRRARAVLANEMGIEPNQELRGLEQAILNRDPSLDSPSDAGSRGTGEHVACPRQLPSSIADFIGRDDHLAEIKRILTDEQTDAARYAVPVIAISGRGAVGKSALALRAAHELAESYLDGHIYADLRGLTGGNATSALLARFLRALGVESVLPDDLAERIEMFRSRVAGKRLLMVLDDVTSEEQVLPVLPGSPRCAVVVTSRARLAGVPGAHWIDVDTFDDATSMEMLARIVGWPRLKAEPEAAAQLVTYCGGLPLALRIAGARLASRPQWRIAELTRRLKSEVRRLDELSHRGLEVRSSIALTYRSLPEQAQRLFRLCALIKAPDFPGWTAAALLNTDLRQAEDALERLVDVQMLDTKVGEDGQLRYSVHDLIRVYAQECLTESETAEERDAALRRMLGARLALAERAHRKEFGGDYTILHGSEPRLDLAEWDTHDLIGCPMKWLDNERAALVSSVRQAAEAGMDELCWDLALTLMSLFEIKGYTDDWRETSELAHAAAVRAGNRVGIAAMLYSLGTLHMTQNHLADADHSFTSALEIFEAENNLHGQALVVRNAAFIDSTWARFGTMLARYNSALVKMRAVGDLIGEVHILTSMAKFRVDEGEFDEADRMLSGALALCGQAGYERGVTHVQTSLSELYLATGQLGLARRALNDVLRTAREIGNRVGEAHALYGLGVVRRREGRMDSAEATLAHALSVAEGVGDRILVGQARHMLGDIAIARADYATAGKHIEQAMWLFEELGMLLWQAKALILLSEVHDDAGENELMKADLEQARCLLAGIGAKQSDRLLRQLDEARSALVPESSRG
ncbi:DNA-binding SARP family transcriptional activator [Kibdelosporangium banguiense]|uniref:DNA-binding SARP family transcriptional activator n=1 Tax=Kibdelosporangium banguiense TaxID=1365924 RepID=A0ABS4TYR1_9PSEU|nr:AfsR/SARP family transcriptional regulator [Kibdelosporangium banguiense]MBP2329094.1 DNA-binding SARP family transcriptional activator [Kibdelosporangium banguiense]